MSYTPYLVADWNPNVLLPRFYALDYDSGSDSNLGFSDVSMAAAGTVAKKTWSGINGLLSILPTVGAGRTIVIAIKNRVNGAVYLKEDAVTHDSFTYRGFRGYFQEHIVATTDFSDNTADRLISGGVIQTAGPNGDSSWTCAAGATVNTFSISAGALPAEPTITEYRIRFTGNVTAGLLNKCATVYSNTATQIVLAHDISLAPANGDTFFIEKCGVLFDAVNFDVDRRIVIRGIAADTVTANSFVGEGLSGAVRLSFCEARNTGASAFIATGADSLQILDTYPAFDAGGNSLVGMGFRTPGGVTLQDWNSILLNATGFLCTTAGALVTLINCVRGTYGNGGVVKNLLEIFSGGYPATRTQFDTNTSFDLIIGRTSSGWRDFKADSGSISPGLICVIEGACTIQNTVCTNAVGVPAIAIDGQNCCVKLATVTGSTGNTQHGLSLQFAGNSIVVVDAATTVTGTPGDILFGDGNAIGKWTDLATTNVVDNKGNDLEGSAGRLINTSQLVNNQSGGALAVGDIVRSNGTTVQVTKSNGNAAAIGNSNTIGAMITSPANNTVGYMCSTEQPICKFDGAPTVGAIAYLSVTTAGQLTTTVPPVAANNNKCRVGRVVSGAGTLFRTSFHPESLAVIADGLA